VLLCGMLVAALLGVLLCGVSPVGGFAGPRRTLQRREARPSNHWPVTIGAERAGGRALRGPRVGPVLRAKKEDPWEAVEDTVVLAGDVVVLGIYSFCQEILDLVQELGVQIDVDPSKVFPGRVLDALREPFFHNPNLDFFYLTLSWIVAGTFTGAFSRDQCRVSAGLSVVLALRTFLLSAGILLGLLVAQGLEPTTRDAIFIAGVLSSMASWRYLFSFVSPFVP